MRIHPFRVEQSSLRVFSHPDRAGFTNESLESGIDLVRRVQAEPVPEGVLPVLLHTAKSGMVRPAREPEVEEQPLLSDKRTGESRLGLNSDPRLPGDDLDGALSREDAKW